MLKTTLIFDLYGDLNTPANFSICVSFPSYNVPSYSMVSGKLQLLPNPKSQISFFTSFFISPTKTNSLPETISATTVIGVFFKYIVAVVPAINPGPAFAAYINPVTDSPLHIGLLIYAV